MLKHLVWALPAVAVIYYVTLSVAKAGDDAMGVPALLGAAWGWLVVRLTRGFVTAWGPVKTWPGRAALGLTLVVLYLLAGICGGYLLIWFFLP